MSRKEKRFEVVYKEGSQLNVEGVRMIYMDVYTGVNYLAVANGAGGMAITPLLDANGNVIITRPEGYVPYGTEVQ